MIDKLMSYENYLEFKGKNDCRDSWKWWKIEIYGMNPKDATKASYDEECGYKPIR